MRNIISSGFVFFSGPQVALSCPPTHRSFTSSFEGPRTSHQPRKDHPSYVSLNVWVSCTMSTPSCATCSMAFGIPFVFKVFHTGSLISGSLKRDKKQRAFACYSNTLLRVLVGKVALKGLESLTLLHCRPTLGGRNACSCWVLFSNSLVHPSLCRNSQEHYHVNTISQFHFFPGCQALPNLWGQPAFDAAELGGMLSLL